MKNSRSGRQMRVLLAFFGFYLWLAGVEIPFLDFLENSCNNPLSKTKTNSKRIDMHGQVADPHQLIFLGACFGHDLLASTLSDNVVAC